MQIFLLLFEKFRELGVGARGLWVGVSNQIGPCDVRTCLRQNTLKMVKTL
jgi:hypothetical protein